MCCALCHRMGRRGLAPGQPGVGKHPGAGLLPTRPLPESARDTVVFEIPSASAISAIFMGVVLFAMVRTFPPLAENVAHDSCAQFKDTVAFKSVNPQTAQKTDENLARVAGMFLFYMVCTHLCRGCAY